MAFARNWRHAWVAETPERVLTREIASLNAVFSEAFTERYRKDGMVGVRVPHLNPAVWKFAIADAEEGAMIWRNARDGIAAFNMVHQSGVEGWMGPLAVHPDYQGQGIGKMIVQSGVEWLKNQGAKVIGLETMPRTMDNVGFYSTLGFVPGHLTVTVTLEAARAGIQSTTISSLSPHERELAMRQCRVMLEQFAPGYDYTREILLTAQHELGDTLFVRKGSEVLSFAVCHSVPLVEGRATEEMRVLKMVAKSEADFDHLVTQLCAHARGRGARRIAIRVQGQYSSIYRRLIARGARVRWTDLRMSVHDHAETKPLNGGIVLSNWEI
ncbi:MAG TPA: GNAT family N-acetyltransferase [Gemmatimonadaceae bacterium]|nr:GNAT family N-acetyltransferase [Gemmatimonadaceae bacterium]